MATKPKRPRDPNQLAKMIVDLSTGETKQPTVSELSAKRSAVGRVGGMKGGKNRAEKLSASERKEAARKAALARWRKD